MILSAPRFKAFSRQPKAGAGSHLCPYPPLGRQQHPGLAPVPLPEFEERSGAPGGRGAAALLGNRLEGCQ